MQEPGKPIHLKFEAKVQGGGPLNRFLATVLGVAVVFAALFLSVFVFAGLLVVGVVAGGWFWWRTRRLRRHLHETIDAATSEALKRAESRPNHAARRNDNVIEGDFIRPKPGGESNDQR